MNKGRNMMWVAGVCLCVSGMSAFSQEEISTSRSGPNRILQLLDDKERNYIEGKADAKDLSQEDLEHIKRVQRLHELEVAKDIETEPAGAQIAQAAPVREASAIEESAIEEIEMQQQENTSVMMRDMARLRAEVLRLNARVEALEMELEGTAESLEEDPRRPYFPIR